ncbi:hypothetical protein, partial [Frankia sp. CiP3]|uniref:hypothetical protein n=1 Tax=Frankia sp. CiP3 TaxID=2880971 RepID=UPI001EF4079C
MLDHEARYWISTASERRLQLQQVTLERAIAAAILLGATNEQEAIETLVRVPGLESKDYDDRLAIADWLASLYPADDGQYSSPTPSWWRTARSPPRA